MPRPVFGRYLPRPSPIHALDPRAKVIAVVALMVSVFFLDRPLDYLVLTAFIALVVALARLRWRELSQGLYAVVLLMSISFLLQLAFTPGEPLAAWGPLTLTREGLRAGLALAVRLAYLATLSALLGFTTSSAALAEGLASLMRPLSALGLPTRRVALVIGVALRFVPTILEQGEQIVRAQRARGIDFSEGNPIRRAKRLLAVLIPLMAACLRRAEELAVAMDARGYELDAPRSRMNPLRLRWQDGLGVALAVGLALFLAWPWPRPWPWP